MVNSNAKSVSTTIAYDILSNLGQVIPGLTQDLEESGKAWQVHGQELTKELAENSGIWKDLIRFSNEPKGASTVQSAGFVSSLRPILSSAYFGRLTRGAQGKVLTALQKSLGVAVMHTIFNDVIEVVRSNDEPVTDFNSYATVLEGPLLNLTGDNREGLNVSGSDFWLSGEKGAAGAYSSSAGRRVLTARLRSSLPKIGEV